MNDTICVCGTAMIVSPVSSAPRPSAAARSCAPNTAEPATSTLAPALATSGAVSGVTPPSISMWIGLSPIIALTRATLSTTG